MEPTMITDLSARDIRFPTSIEKHGSDAMNKSPDYSCTYVILATDSTLEGHGISFTLGNGNDIVVYAIKIMSKLVVGKKLSEIYDNFGDFWRSLTSEDQMRWIGPEKGVIHLATAAVINALWDLWAKMEKKPLWKLLVDMEPERLVSTIDFRYLADALTEEEAIDLIKKMQPGKEEREAELLANGYPAYTTSCGWLGYSDERITKLAEEAIAQGFSRFKMKVGADIQDDIRRAKIFRKVIGYDRIWMVDANQRWEVQESIDWMKQLAEFKPLWIEEPTNPDDILGHKAISEALAPLGIGVATGEQCQNRIMFKQFLESRAMQYCQVDACRLGGVNEILAVMLMAVKFGVPLCPHAGGVGLCELVQHLSIFDYISVSGSLDGRMLEYTDHLHEHFKDPVVLKHGCYQVPKAAGYTIDMKEESLKTWEYPDGGGWNDLFDSGVFKRDMSGVFRRESSGVFNTE